MSKGADLENTALAFLDDLTKTANRTTARQNRVLGVSAARMLGELRGIYEKLEKKGTGAYEAQQLYARLRNIKDLLPAREQKALEKQFRADLATAQKKGGQSAAKLSEILGNTSETLKKNAKPNLPAIEAAGLRLKDFWAKENTQFRDRVTALTQAAAAEGSSWRALSQKIEQLLQFEKKQGTESARSKAVNRKVGGIANRADLIARTEMATAFVQGQISKYRAAGYEWARWSAAAERSCPFCISRDGLIYTMNDIEGAIPAHPRCRCSLIPTDPPADWKNKRFKDKGVDAAESLDDAYWAKSRAEKLRRFQKDNPKVDDAQIRKFARTPTNTQKFLRPDSPAPDPAWVPSGQLIPNLSAVVINAQKAAERAKAQDAKKAEQKRLEAEAKAAEAAAKKAAEQKAKDDAARAEREAKEAEAKAAADQKAAKAKAAKEAAEKKKADEKAAKQKAETDRIKKELDDTKFKFARDNRPDGTPTLTREMWDSLTPKMKERLYSQSENLFKKRKQDAERKVKELEAKAAKAKADAEKREIDSQYDVVQKAYGQSKKIDRDKFGSLSASDRKRLYDNAVKQLVSNAENKGKAEAEKKAEGKAEKFSETKLKRMLKELGDNVTAGGLTADEMARALQRAKKYMIFDKSSDFAAVNQAMLDIAGDVQRRVAQQQAEKSRKVSGVSKKFKGDEHFVSQKLSKLNGKDIDKMFELMEAEGGLIAENAKKLQRFINHHQIALYFSNASLAPKGWSSKAEAKLKASWEEVRNSEVWQRAVKRSEGIHGKKNVLGDSTEAQLAMKWNQGFMDDATKGDWFTAKNYNANKQSGGYTKVGTSFVTIKDARTNKPPTKLDIDVLKKSYTNALEEAAKNGGSNRKQLTAEDAYREVYKTKKDWSGGWINTIIHELGHQVHFKGGQTNMSGQITDHYNNKVADSVTRDGAIFPSKYAAVNNFEQFAECFTTYMLAPETLKRLSPKTYDWIENHILNALNWRYD